MLEMRIGCFCSAIPQAGGLLKYSFERFALRPQPKSGSPQPLMQRAASLRLRPPAHPPPAADEKQRYERPNARPHECSDNATGGLPSWKPSGRSCDRIADEAATGRIGLLFAHQDFENLDGGRGDRGAGAEDGGGAVAVQFVVILMGDYAANDHDDVLAAELLELCEGRDVCLNVISKSGTTTEPAIAFRLFKELLEENSLPPILHSG